jgi:hypothetical protein
MGHPERADWRAHGDLDLLVDGQRLLHPAPARSSAA